MWKKFYECDRETLMLLPPAIQDWLSEDHIARFIVDVMDKLDLNKLECKYSAQGGKAYPISMMLSLLFYGYITGTYSSRKIEKATYDSIAFRFIAANHHPDHDTIAEFRKIFSGHLADIFLQVLTIASELGFLRLGTIALDGSKIKANASKHTAMSYRGVEKAKARLEEEVKTLLKIAEEADAKPIEGLDIPQELANRAKRLSELDKITEEIKKRASARYEKEDREYNEKMEKRQKYTEITGKKPSGKEPKKATAGPKPTDQINLTDQDSRIMLKSGKTFEQAYNAQAAVDVNTMLIVAQHVTQNTNDKKELVPTLDNVATTENALGKKCHEALADAGFYGEENVKECEKRGIKPFIPQKRDSHNSWLAQKISSSKDEPPQGADAVTTMKHCLKTEEGKKKYAKRKTTIEPTFGIIKNVMGFRNFSVRGLENVQNEWSLVTIAYNLKRLFALSQQKPATASI